MKFRADINCLRAIAVIAVLLYHYRMPHFSGGFSGVDVFFVISGYLMSQIIISAINDQNFSVIEFYKKRTRRIVPALVAMVVVVTLVTFFRYFPSDFQANQKNGFSSIFFLSNIYYLQTSDYFAPETEANIFLHTWSLSVEWQFYLLYPFLLILLKKLVKNDKSLFFTLTAITIVVFVSTVFFNKHYPEASFYLLPTRSWEMLFGGLAYTGGDWFQKIKGKKIIAFAGYAVILGSIVYLDKLLPWPGVYTLLPVVATFLVLTANENNFFLIKNSVIQFVGRISYSLYLWHWPVLAIWRYEGFPLTTGSRILLTAISFILAFLSYQFVETPRKIRVKTLVYSSAVLGCIMLVFCFSRVNAVLFKPEAVLLASYEDDNKAQIDSQMSTGQCFIKLNNSIADYKEAECLAINQNTKNYLLLGDSHAAHLSQSLKQKLAVLDINMLQANAVGCFPLIQQNGDVQCNQIRQFIFEDFIVKNASHIDGVILSANWTDLTGQKDFEVLSLNLQRTIDYLRKYKVDVLVLGQNEYYNRHYSFLKAREVQYGEAITSNNIQTKPLLLNQFLSKNLDSFYVNIYNEPGAVPPLSQTGIPYMFDKNHFTKYGADLTVDKILSHPAARHFFKIDIQKTP